MWGEEKKTFKRETRNKKQVSVFWYFCFIYHLKSFCGSDFMFCIQSLVSVPQQSDVHLQHLHKSIKTQPEKFVGEWNCQNKIRPTTFIFQFLFSLTYCMICWKSKFETCESSIKLCRDLVNYSLISTCKIKHFAKQFWFPQTLRLTQSKILSDLCWVLNKAVSRCNKTSFSLSEVEEIIPEINLTEYWVELTR